jgi:hypothetical protein
MMGGRNPYYEDRLNLRVGQVKHGCQNLDGVIEIQTNPLDLQRGLK